MLLAKWNVVVVVGIDVRRTQTALAILQSSPAIFNYKLLL